MESTPVAGGLDPNDPDALIGSAMVHINASNPAEAVPLLRQALAIDASRTEALDLLGEALLVTGDTAGAVEALGASIRADPEGNPAKYMYMGQIHSGADAVAFYSEGIKLLAKRGVEVQEEIEKCTDPAQLESLTDEFDTVRRQSCSAHCSIVELFMSDLCDEPEAESQCESGVLRATELAPESPEPWVATANLRIVQRRKGEALQALRRSVACWLRKKGAKKRAGKDDGDDGNDMDDDNGDGDDDGDGDGDGDKDGDESGSSDEEIDDDVATVDLRFATARLFVELGEPSEALEVLGTVLDSDDTLPDVWYLYAECLYDTAAATGQGAGDDDAKETLYECREAYERARDLYGAMGLGVEEQVSERISERLAQLPQQAEEGDQQ